jgi:hypothetical protein
MIRLFKSIITMILLLSFLLFTACTTPDIGNHPPCITSLTANPSTVSINQTTTLTCIANDVDGDTLTYIWNKDTTDDEEDEDDEDDEDEPPEDERILPSTFKAPGTISGSGKTVTWKAPSTAGTYTVTCTVSDGRGGEDTETLTVTVVVNIIEIVDIVHNLSKDTYYNTIQSALDDADNDNTIEVANGTYDESIVFPSNKKIILQSINGFSLTIIRGNDGLSTVTFDGSLAGTTLEGFTINHQVGNSGRGIYITHSNISINNCTISSNTIDFNGGGILNSYSELTITKSTVSGNATSSSGWWGGNGGGIYNSGRLTISGSTISGNTASSLVCSGGNGGGIYNSYDGRLTISGSTISGNTTSALQICTEPWQVSGHGGHGGGIYNEGSLTVSESTISNNTADVNGGGIYNDDSSSSLTITGSTISGNSAAYWGEGGGIYFNFETSIAFSIGGDSENEKNTICGNYLTGSNPNLYQQIRDYSGSLYKDYRNTNYISAYCE